MGISSGLLALAILAAQGPSCPPECATTFSVRVLTLDGLDWRTASYSRLQPIARQGTSTVWTADRALVGLLKDRARSATNFGKIVSTNDATLTHCEAVNYVAAVERFADGPINQSSAIAFLPKPERLDERFAVKLSGRKLDQGILTQIMLEETHVDVMHAVPQTEALLPCTSKTTRTATDIGRDVLNVVLAGQPRESPQSITCSVQVPEISQAKVEGEWLIPNNGVLLVSLGVKTVADDEGKAVVRERVAVIEANPAMMPSANRLSSVEAVQPPLATTTNLAMPAQPTRSLPLPLGPTGDVVEGDLPPLPESLASADLDRIKPAPYQPSPQAPHMAGTIRDTGIARTSYDSAPLTKEGAEVEGDLDASKAVARSYKNIIEKILETLEQSGVSIKSEAVVEGSIKAETRAAVFEEMLDVLSKIGVEISIDIHPGSPLLNPARSVCETCDGDDPFCPAKARASSIESANGGLKVAPEPSAQLGVSLKDAKGEQAFGSFDLKEVLKTPGKTETTLVPLGGNVSLEIKTTVVPSQFEKAKNASKNADAPTVKR